MENTKFARLPGSHVVAAMPARLCQKATRCRVRDMKVKVLVESLNIFLACTYVQISSA